MASLHGKPDPVVGTCDLRIFGNLTIDYIFAGIAEMPSWGKEAIAGVRTDAVAGQAGGMAFATTKLGVLTELIATVGADPAGERIRRELGRAGVGVDGVFALPDSTTPMTVALVRPDGERAFVSHLGPARLPGPTEISGSQLTQARVVALVGTSNLPGFDLRDAATLLRASRESGSLTLFDPGWDSKGWTLATREAILSAVCETDFFLPNLDEAMAITNRRSIPEILRFLGEACQGTVIVKAGAVGSYVLSQDGPTLAASLPARAENAVGAGDVYNAGLVARHLSGGTIRQCMSFATAAASLYVGRSTDRFPTFEECSELETAVHFSLQKE